MVSCQSSVRFSSHQYEKNVDPGSGSFDYSLLKLDEKQKLIINESEKFIGTPYCYGGTGINCLDCSGFTQLIFQKIGFKLPRSAEDQYSFAKLISKEEAKPGDLVFFRRSKKISHVGIYLGNNSFIHSSSSNGVVVQSLEDRYYKEHFAGFGRVIQ